MTYLSRKLIAAIVGAMLLIFLVVWGPAQCRRANTAEKNAELATEKGNAAIEAGAEAGNTIANVTANNLETDRAVASGQDDIRRAPEGQKGMAARLAACKFKANQNKPECRPKEQSR